MTVNEFKYKQLEQAGRELAESTRHNKVTEALEGGKLEETRRHQMVQEGIDYGKLDETIRHDSRMESLQGESNRIANRDADTRKLTALGNYEKAKMDTALAPLYYENEAHKTSTNDKKVYSDINVNDRNATTNEFKADTEYKKWQTDTILRAGEFAVNSVLGGISAGIKLVGAL